MTIQKDIIFDYSLNGRLVNLEHSNVGGLDWEGLKSIAMGNFYIFFEPERHYIRMKTGIIDYLNQFEIVLDEIDSGNYNPFSVSCDYYSNSFEYQYDPKTKLMRILEVNDGEFDFQIDYFLFKDSFLNFRIKTIEDLCFLYPDLKNNSFFTAWSKKP